MSKSAELVWEKCLSFLKDNIPLEAYKIWFDPIKVKKLEGNSLSIEVPSKFFYEFLEDNYIDVLKVAISRELGESAKLVYIIRMENTYGNSQYFTEKIPSSNNPNIKPQNIYDSSKLKGDNNQDLKNPFIIPGIQNLKIESQLNPNYNFENFIEGNCNRLARSVGIEVSKKPGGTSFNPLFIFSNVGLGKTHLVHAIGIGVKDRYPDKTVLYITAEKFTQQYIQAAAINNKRNDFIHFYQLIDVLIVDDIQLLSGKPKTQEVFFHIFNHLHQNGKQVIMTSDKAPVDMQDIEQRLLSRFKWGLSAQLQKPDYEARYAILKNRVYRDGVNIPDDVLSYVAKNIESSIRELEGVIISLIAQSSFNKREITPELAKEVIENYVKDTKKEISIDYIKKTISEYFKMDINIMQSKTRKRDVVQARQIAMYFSKKYTKSSLAFIGSQIGKKDHATVLHACKMVNNLKEIDKQFNFYVEELNKKFSS